MNFKLKIWRQKNKFTKGKFVYYNIYDISQHSSFLEMLDILNENLVLNKKDTISFDHDCREGICGMCSLVVNGYPHGHIKGLTVCQLHMRNFKNNDLITIEPFRAKPFPVIKDLIVDRTSLDKIIQSGGFINSKIGSAQDANSILIKKDIIDKSMDAASCIGCGACVASCINASAMLFVGAKIDHLNNLPHGLIEKNSRVISMVNEMDKMGFGNCRNYRSCEMICPKKIKLNSISKLNRDYIFAKIKNLFCSKCNYK